MAAADSNSKFPFFILAGILLGILFFGLRPKGFRFENGVRWLQERPGISFTNYGLVYATPFSSKSDRSEFGKNGFGIQMAIRSDETETEEWRFLLCAHNGKDRDQLLVGQYGSSIVIMNGDDYPNRRKWPRMVLNRVMEPDRPIVLSISAGHSGTKAWVDGLLVKSDSRLRLDFPSTANTYLTLGNSVYGKHSWQGEICKMAIYDRVIGKAETSPFAGLKSETKVEDFASKYHPFLLYAFDQGKGTRIFDCSGNGIHLEMPTKMSALKKEILSVPWRNLELDFDFYFDLVINLLGFIPLGFALAYTFREFTNLSDQSVPISVLLCFLLSLGIELVQVFIPSRSSNLHDLVLNTVGGWVGAIAQVKLIKIPNFKHQIPNHKQN